MALHRSPRIEWLDDSLPDLARVRSRGDSFDLVMLTAVWMHLDVQQRRQAMPNLAALLRGGGTVIMTLRHGPSHRDAACSRYQPMKPSRSPRRIGCIPS